MPVLQTACQLGTCSYILKVKQHTAPGAEHMSARTQSAAAPMMLRCDRQGFVQATIPTGPCHQQILAQARAYVLKVDWIFEQVDGDGGNGLPYEASGLAR